MEGAIKTLNSFSVGKHWVGGKVVPDAKKKRYDFWPKKYSFLHSFAIMIEYTRPLVFFYNTEISQYWHLYVLQPTSVLKLFHSIIDHVGIQTHASRILTFPAVFNRWIELPALRYPLSAELWKWHSTQSHSKCDRFITLIYYRSSPRWEFKATLAYNMSAF